jgi:hypothetical protein
MVIDQPRSSAGSGTTGGFNMELPEYITKEEVQRVCSELGIGDWTELTTASVQVDEASRIRAALGAETLDVSLEDFREGLEVELEHGVRYTDANVTNNHPLLTGKIVLAHLKEMLDYYVRLKVAELEGDMFKALQAGDPEQVSATYVRVLAARTELARRESDPA